MSTSDAREQGSFPVSAGILFGLGRFFDGIVFHEVLQGASQGDERRIS